MLPNSPNVIMAAERAAELSEKVVHVVAVALAAGRAGGGGRARPDRERRRQRRGDGRGARAVRTGAVAPAARHDADGRFAVGDAVGFVDERARRLGRRRRRRWREVLGALGADAELVTCIAGEGAPLDDDDVAALAPDGVELELEDGGQPRYWWLLTAE